MAGTHPAAQGHRQSTDTTGRAGLRSVQSRAGRAGALGRVRLVRGAAEGSGGPGSRRPLSCVARGAGAARPGWNHAGVGTAHHRSDRDHDAAQGQRGVGGGAGSDARTEPTARPAVAAGDEELRRWIWRSPLRRSRTLVSRGTGEQFRDADAAGGVGAAGLQGGAGAEGRLPVVHRRAVFFPGASGRP